MINRHALAIGLIACCISAAVSIWIMWAIVALCKGNL